MCVIGCERKVAAGARGRGEATRAPDTGSVPIRHKYRQDWRRELKDCWTTARFRSRASLLLVVVYSLVLGPGTGRIPP